MSILLINNKHLFKVHVQCTPDNSINLSCFVPSTNGMPVMNDATKL